jgi:hypothetical protein
MMNSVFKRCVLANTLALACVMPATIVAQGISPSTPVEFVATYDSLATAILATKQTEQNLVRSILSTTYGHANAARARAERALQSGDQQQAQAAFEELAGHVAQLGNEGDNAVAGIRKRLVEGGHHHNSQGESQGIYEPGFVIVTRSAKQKLLELSQNIARLSRNPDKNALAQEWSNVDEVWKQLSKQKK